jgi:hypothetical protein
MNFPDEEYVRLYVRDTDTWRAIRFEGQAVLALMLRRFDGSGIYKFGKRTPARSIAAAIGCDEEFAQKGLRLILEEEIWEQLGDRFFWPKWDEAQFCNRSDKLRKRLERARKASLEFEKSHADVTGRHENGRLVTDCPEQRTSVTPRRGEGERGEARDLDPEESPERNQPTPVDAFERSFTGVSPGANELFEAWQAESGKTGVKLTDRGIREIFEQLVSQKLTTQDVIEVVRGAKLDKWARESARLMPSPLLKSAEQRAKFKDMYRNPPAPAVNEFPGRNRTAANPNPTPEFSIDPAERERRRAEVRKLKEQGTNAATR